MPRGHAGRAVCEGDRLRGVDAQAAAGDEQQIRGGTSPASSSIGSVLALAETTARLRPA